MLKIENLTKKYGSTVAVEHLDMEIEPGIIFGFIGHNGAGKTTTLRCIAGILEFDEGSISIDGKDIEKESILAKSITAFIPDNPDLYDFMTGLSYLNFIADIYGISSEDRISRINEYATSLELKGDLGSAIGSYSHGMKQKLAIISALIRDPKLLILDEPFVGLDPIASRKLKDYLQSLCDKGSTVLFSTHVLEVAQKLCDQVAIIKKGHIVAKGKTTDVVGDSSLEDVFLELAEERS